MRFIQLLPFLGVSALRHTSLEPVLTLTAADPDRTVDIGGSIYDGSHDTGCTVAGTRLSYACGPEKPPEAESLAQLVSFRVDCRKAGRNQKNGGMNSKLEEI